MINSTTKIITSFTDKEGNETVITGKDAYLTEFNVDYHSSIQEIYTLGGGSIEQFKPSEPITITLQFKLNPNDKDGNANYLIESFMNGFKPKRRISKLRVEDCSIEELLFAVRKQIK